MSLEKMVDISEIMHEVAEGNLVKLSPKLAPLGLDALIQKLEEQSGDLSYFSKEGLFKIEKELALPENKEKKARWDAAVRLGTRIRMHLLRHKALKMLEDFQNMSSTSSSADVAYCRTVLGGVLAEDTERVKAKYASNRPGVTDVPADEIDEISSQFGEN